MKDCVSQATSGEIYLRRSAIVRDSDTKSSNSFEWRAMSYARRWKVFDVARNGSARPFDFALPRLRVLAGDNKLMLECAPEDARKSDWADLIGVDMIAVMKVMQTALSNVLYKSGAHSRDDRLSAPSTTLALGRSRRGTEIVEDVAIRQEDTDTDGDGNIRLAENNWSNIDLDDCVVALDGDEQEQVDNGDEFCPAGDDIEKSSWSIASLLQFLLGFSAPYGRGLKQRFTPPARIAVRSMVYMQSCVNAWIGNDDERRWRLFGRAERAQLASFSRVLPRVHLSTADDFRPYVVGKTLAETGLLSNRFYKYDGKNYTPLDKGPRSWFDAACGDRPCFGFWRGKVKSFRVCVDGFHLQVNPDCEAREKRAMREMRAPR